MAKQSIANPVVSLGLDSSGLRTGIASSMGDVKSAGSKIGTALKSAIGTPLSLAGSAAAMAVPLNAALNIASMAASAAKSVLTAPMNALMDRESFLAEQRGMPLLEGSDAGYTGVFARLGAQWNDLLADMMVALDKAFDFRGLIEYGRGAMAAVSAIMSAFLGPLKEVTQNPEHLEEMFRLGGEMLIDVFEQIAEIMSASFNTFLDVFQSGSNIFVDTFNAFVGLTNEIRKLIPSFGKLVASIYSFTPEIWLLSIGTNLGAKAAQDLLKGLGLVNNNGKIEKPEGPIGKIARFVITMDKLPPEWAAVLGGTARAIFAGMGFAPDKVNAKDAANLSNKLIPMMEKMQTARLGSSITSDSTAIVEAVARASVAGPGQDLQQRVALAAEETVRQQKATNTLQEKILAAYNAAGGDARFKILAAP